MPFTNFSRWLHGTFTCRECGRRVHLMSFGYGEAVCPECYNKVEPFLMLDESYWLNRLLIRLGYGAVKRDFRVEEEPSVEEFVHEEEPIMGLVPQHSS